MPTLNQLITRPRRPPRRFLRSAGPLAAHPQRRATCIRVYTTSPKKPNSAVRKVAKVRFTDGAEALAYIPGFGHSLGEHSVVLVRGGRAPDLPGVRYHLVRGAYDFTAKESLPRHARRSKFGVARPKSR